MKKIAFFVEGQTEQFFVNKLLIEIAGSRNIAMELRKFRGKGKSSKQIFPRELAQDGHHVNHFVLVYDCAGDESVKSRILEEAPHLLANGYTEVVGLRDLYPLQDLHKLLRRLKFGWRDFEPPLPKKTSIIVANREIEEWFLAECHHFSCIDKSLNMPKIIKKMGFNPCEAKGHLRFGSASQDMNRIYRIAGKNYSKNKIKIQKTVECLDYNHLYYNLRHKIDDLGLLLDKIDRFLAL
jgi:hypothetical protein